MIMSINCCGKLTKGSFKYQVVLRYDCYCCIISSNRYINYLLFRFISISLFDSILNKYYYNYNLNIIIKMTTKQSTIINPKSNKNKTNNNNKSKSKPKTTSIVK